MTCAYESRQIVWGAKDVTEAELRRDILDCRCFHCTEACRARSLRVKPLDAKIIERWERLGKKAIDG